MCFSPWKSTIVLSATTSVSMLATGLNDLWPRLGTPWSPDESEAVREWSTRIEFKISKSNRVWHVLWKWKHLANLYPTLPKVHIQRHSHVGAVFVREVSGLLYTAVRNNDYTKLTQTSDSKGSWSLHSPYHATCKINGTWYMHPSRILFTMCLAFKWHWSALEASISTSEVLCSVLYSC